MRFAFLGMKLRSWPRASAQHIFDQFCKQSGNSVPVRQGIPAPGPHPHPSNSPVCELIPFPSRDNILLLSATLAFWPAQLSTRSDKKHFFSPLLLCGAADRLRGRACRPRPAEFAESCGNSQASTGLQLPHPHPHPMEGFLSLLSVADGDMAICQTQPFLLWSCDFLANKQGGPGRQGSAERTIARCCLPHRLVSPRPQHRHSQSKGMTQIRLSSTCLSRHIADERAASALSFLCFTTYNLERGLRH